MYFLYLFPTIDKLDNIDNIVKCFGDLFLKFLSNVEKSFSHCFVILDAMNGLVIHIERNTECNGSNNNAVTY